MTTSVRFGAELHRGGVTFRLWAPAAKRVEVMVDRPYPMVPTPFPAPSSALDCPA
jgi:1,4-alpha-glucan branching enzyme